MSSIRVGTGSVQEDGHHITVNVSIEKLTIAN